MKHFLKMAMGCVGIGLMSLVVSCTDAEKGDDMGVLRVKLAVDGSVVTRAESSVAAPAVADFDLTITSTDGDYTNHWESLEELTTDNRFEVGVYQVVAQCGNIADEGFEKSAFAAEATCRVMPNQTAVVNMTASLVNAGVRVSRSEAFSKYFTETTVELTSAAGAVIPFVEGESRVAYVAPENFVLKVTYTKPNGTKGSKTFRVNGVQPRTIYTVHLDVNGGEVGQAGIVVEFDDSVNVENVEIEIDEQ